MFKRHIKVYVQTLIHWSDTIENIRKRRRYSRHVNLWCCMASGV